MPWFKYFPADHEAEPLLKLCSFASQGVWTRLICIAAQSGRFGYVLLADRKPTLAELARVFGGTPDEVGPLIDELERNGVFSRDRTGTIFCRRMVREAKRLAASAKGGEIGGRTTYYNKKGIYRTQDATQDATHDDTQAPESRIQNPERAEEAVHPAPRTKAPAHLVVVKDDTGTGPREEDLPLQRPHYPGHVFGYKEVLLLDIAEDLVRGRLTAESDLTRKRRNELEALSRSGDSKSMQHARELLEAVAADRQDYIPPDIAKLLGGTAELLQAGTPVSLPKARYRLRELAKIETRLPASHPAYIAAKEQLTRLTAASRETKRP
jgi:hypothetical protein